MIEKLKQEFLKHYSVPEHKRLFENFVSLSIIQGLNYILPLISFPYLVRVLGVEKFGLLSFAQATIGYFQILTDYGFNLSATREISIYRDDKIKIEDIFNAVMIIKFLLIIISLILLTALVFSFEKFRINWLIYYLTFGVVVGNSLFPIWFFQGLERMKYITILNVFAKGIFTIAIFLLVKSEADYWKVPLFNSFGFIIAGLISLSILRHNFGIKFTSPQKKEIVHQLKEGWYIFVSSIVTSVYTISASFILGIFANNAIVGYFAGAEKLIQALKGLLHPLNQSVYPFIARKVNQSYEKGLNFIRKLIIFVMLITGMMSLLTFVFSNDIVYIVLGRNYTESIPVLKIMAIIPFAIGFSNVFGMHTLLTFNRKKDYQNILISASVFYLILSLVIVPIFHHIGSAIAIVTVEVFIAVSMFICLQKRGIKIIMITNKDQQY